MEDDAAVTSQERAMTSTPVEHAPPRIACADACGASLPEAEINQHGWQFLEIQRRYRCPACFRALRAAAGIKGTTRAPFVDEIAPDSRGALRKETASTIAAPSVKV
jgi:hypothetical protein